MDVVTERLARLGELWSANRYFHPFLAYRGIDWDAALASAVPRALTASDSASYRDVIQSMLDALDDPVTRVLPVATATKSVPAAADADRVEPIEAGSARIAHWPADGLLCVTLNETTIGSDFQEASLKLAAVLPMLADATGVLFDLRSAEPCDWLPVLLEVSQLEGMLVPRPVISPAERLRMHHGLADQRSPQYHSGFRVLDGRTVTPVSRSVDLPIVFLVNSLTILPSVMVALQDAGQAAVLAEGPVTDESLIRTHTVSMGEGIQVRMRLGELVHVDGTTGFLPDVILPARCGGDTGDPCVQRALAFLRGHGVERPPRPHLPAVAAPPPDPGSGDNPHPSLGYRVVAAFKTWSAIHYFFPYRDLIDGDWDMVLRSFLPRFIAAEDALAYHLAVAEMYTHIGDSHGVVRSETLASHFGAVPSALYVRWIEDAPVVCGFRDEKAARAAGIEVGDVVVEVDGEGAVDRFRRHARYMAASTPHRLMARAADFMLFGADGSAARVTIQGRDGRGRAVEIPRKAAYPRFPDGRSGPTVRRLAKDIGYVDLARLEREDADAALDGLWDAKAIIFDMRGYPRPLAPRAIVRRLAGDAEVPVARFEVCLLLGPADEGRQRCSWIQTLGPRDPDDDRYAGLTVMLIDERTQSYAEHVGLYLQAANGTVFVGSNSAGADGGVTSFTVPGGITLSFSGQAVRHADGRQLQRVGLTPHVHATPTLEGIRAGRDEVLEAALRYLRDP